MHCSQSGVVLLSDSGYDTAVQEATALGYRSDYVNVYSNSWGPPDDGYYVEGPSPLVQSVLQSNVQQVGGHYLEYLTASQNQSMFSISVPR